MPTELLFRDDAYLAETTATIVAINERGGIELDRTVFYATGGGQPGDAGLYSYSHCNEPLETRWVEDGIPDFFYTNEGAARQAVLSLREEVGEADWTPMRIERIEIEPMTDENVLILLNDGIAAILTAYEIVETVS